MAGPQKPVGQTASAGFQVGVRRTLPMSVEHAWQALTSPEGYKLWLGDVSSVNLAPKQRFTTLDGATGEFRVVKPPVQVRLTWQPQNWARPCTLQIRVIPASGGRSTISFHQENLPDANVRAEMKAHWEAVLSRLADPAAFGSP